MLCLLALFGLEKFYSIVILLACFHRVFFWYCLLFRVAIHFLTSLPMLARGFQATVEQRIFYSTLVHLCLVLCGWYKFKELPAFAVTCNSLLPKLFADKFYICDHQNFIHSGFCVIMMLICHIGALFLLA